MQVNVLNKGTGKTTAYQVGPGETVYDLKKKIEALEGVKCYTQKLCFAGKHLANDEHELDGLNTVVMIYAPNEDEPLDYDPKRKSRDEQCTLEIVGGNRVDVEESVYWEMAHGAAYKVRLFNAFYVKCEFRLEIDGRPMGRWLVPPRHIVELERPGDVAKQFTFFRTKYAVENGGLAPKGTGIEANREQNGLVKATFTPHKLAFESELYSFDPPPSDFGSRSLAERAVQRLFAKHGYNELKFKTFPRGVPDGGLLKLELAPPEPEEDCGDEDGFNNLFGSGDDEVYRSAEYQSTGPTFESRRERGKAAATETAPVGAAANWASGATALQRESLQTFRTVKAVPTDLSRQQVCMLRLVACKDEVIDAAALDLTPCEPLKPAAYPAAVGDA